MNVILVYWSMNLRMARLAGPVRCTETLDPSGGEDLQELTAAVHLLFQPGVYHGSRIGSESAIIANYN